MHEQSPKQSFPGLRRLFHMSAAALHAVVLLLAVGVVGYAASPFLDGLPRPATQPSTMEKVDWHDPYSSVYCLACHRQVAPAMAGLDVQQGHSHNVILNPEQIQAIQKMGTVAGPDGVLICMSCHKLNESNPHMLATPLTDSELCRHCHPQQFSTVGTRHDLRTSADHEPNRFGQTAHTGGPCSACHLSHHYARNFEPSELDPDGRCVTCHTIGRAAEKLARPTMEHPDSHCVICHDPHNDSNQHFLKEPGAQMCGRCHMDYGAGPAKGMHPLGTMDYDVPKILVDAGAQTLGNPRELTCLTCHSTHSSTEEPLLILPADSNQLCLACHEKDLTGQDGHESLGKHGQSPTLTVPQRALVERRGGRVGRNGQLLCVSCHKVHGAEHDSSLSVFRPRFEDACSACHEDKANVAGSSHDLRFSIGARGNPTAGTLDASGVCSSCHTAHGPARMPAPTAGDVTGQCATCHQPGGWAGSKLAGVAGHPDSKCTECHDPHKGQAGDFLSQPAGELCRTCHPDQYALAGGPHDRLLHPEKWADDTAGTEGLCQVCHVSHGNKGTGLFRASVRTDRSHDAACLACHPGTQWNSQSDVAAIHPQQIRPEQKRVPVSLVPVDIDGNMRVGCRTCHNVHGPAEPVHLARVQPGEPTANLCTHCHQDKSLISRTSHAPELLGQKGFDTDSCKPCHAMHAQPGDTWGLMLSPRFLPKPPPAASQPADGPLPCMACHQAGGVAPMPGITSHPAGFMFNTIAPEAPGYLPLFTDKGMIDTHGQITCRTCHLSHGRSDLLEAAANEGALSLNFRQSAMQIQLRPFAAPNLCTQCHGIEARSRFLYFHDATKRTISPPVRPSARRTQEQSPQ